MSLSYFGLSGRAALVTGAGRGIGRTLAVGLASAGADVAITDIDLSQAGEAKREIESMGRKCLLVEADVTDPGGIEKMVSETAGNLGGLHILVNNAGTNIRMTLDEVGEKDWDKVLDLNLKSFFFITRRAGAEMKKAGGRQGGQHRLPHGLVRLQEPARADLRPYSASKGGVISLTRSFAVEWAKENIQVNAICPTYIETPLTQVLKDDKPVYDAITARTPMGASGRWRSSSGPASSSPRRRAPS